MTVELVLVGVPLLVASLAALLSPLVALRRRRA
jgi:hypothetical protein